MRGRTVVQRRTAVVVLQHSPRCPFGSGGPILRGGCFLLWARPPPAPVSGQGQVEGLSRFHLPQRPDSPVVGKKTKMNFRPQETVLGLPVVRPRFAVLVLLHPPRRPSGWGVLVLRVVCLLFFGRGRPLPLSAIGGR